MRFLNLLYLIPFVLLFTCLVHLYINREINNREKDGNTVFLRTFDTPKGKWYSINDSDPTPIRQFWFVRGGFYYLWHESGNVTFVDTPTFQKLRGIN